MNRKKNMKDLVARLPQNRKGWIKRGVIGILLFISALFLSSCGPSPIVKTITPSQTGFLIPLTDTKDQVKFQSAQYFNDNKVPAHQIVIQSHGISDNNGGTNYYPNQLLVLVDRSAVTKNWTSASPEASNSTSAHTNQSFAEQSANGVKFHIEASCTGYIDEAEAATYLYSFKGTDSNDNPAIYEVDSLGTVMDTIVWGSLNDALSRIFGNKTFDVILNDKGDLFALADKEITNEFQKKGLTLTSCGMIGGTVADDPLVQAAYSAAVIQQTGEIKAKAQATTVSINNTTIIGQAEAQATSTTFRNQASLNFLKSQGELLGRYPGLVGYTYATKSNGVGPSVIMGGTSPLVPYFTIPTATPTK